MLNFNKILTLSLCMLFGTTMFAQQDRYLKEVFSDVDITRNVVYGYNSALTLQGAVKVPLVMDVYEPSGDTQEARPLILVLHSGNFLPRIVNGGIIGTRSDSSAVEVATRLAKMGYVVASADYRLGWNPNASTQPLRALGIIQAAYRGMQDGRNCVRFFRHDADNTNTYKIDKDRVAVWGNGTGGYIGLAMAGLDNYNKIITTTMPQGKFLFDPSGGSNNNTPMVVPNFHGNINGDTTVIAPAGAFGYAAGDTSNFANYPGQPSDVSLVVNVGGAIGDISWIDENTPPIISFHHFADQFAPYESADVVVPGSMLIVVEVQGSKLIAEKQNEFGNNDILGTHSDVYTTQAMTNAGIAGHNYQEALYPVVNEPNIAGQIEGVVIDWWDGNSVPVDPTNNPMELPWNELSNPLAPGGVTFHQSAQFTNVGMSATKARTNIDTLIGYFAPRAYLALDLETVSTDNISAQEVAMELAPNPTSTIFNITSHVDAPIQQVRIFDLNGRLVRQYDAVNENKLTVDRSNLASGMHIVMVTFEEGVVSKKVMFN